MGEPSLAQAAAEAPRGPAEKRLLFSIWPQEGYSPGKTIERGLLGSPGGEVVPTWAIHVIVDY